MSSEIRKILIANRGEIAVRIARTCRERNITSVAVYSSADTGARHTRVCDQSLFLGASPAADSYLDAAKILDCAKRSGADAIHPGYGFLSERADFSRAVADAGMVFIGPPPAVIEGAGNKVLAKEIARRCAVPCLESLSIPALPLTAEDSAALEAFVEAQGFPLLIKAAGGGGGRGMVRVQNLDELRAGLEPAARVAQKAFGDGRLFIERCIDSGRHIEAQIAGDCQGNALCLGLRECSAQRLHQKIIEEAPPALPPAVADAIAASAESFAIAAAYQNLGTVEFILDRLGNFYLLEVNTRLQVEHPVTECTTGIDLVGLQIDLAGGKSLASLGLTTRPVVQGHAIECRVCAEDTANNFIAQTGSISAFGFEPRPGLRVDSGITRGSRISHYYDSLLAKVITHADSREAALRAMECGLESFRVGGVRTNIDFLMHLIDTIEFKEGRYDLDLIANEVPRFRDGVALRQAVQAGVALLLRAHRHEVVTLSSVLAFPPVQVRVEDQPFIVSVAASDDSAAITVRRPATSAVTVHIQNIVRPGPGSIYCTIGHEKIVMFREGRGFDSFQCFGTFGPFRFSIAPLETAAAALGSASGNGVIASPLPGKILEVRARTGASVSAGEIVAIVESMKMEHPIIAPRAGVVLEVLKAAGETIAPQEPIIRIE